MRLLCKLVGHAWPRRSPSWKVGDTVRCLRCPEVTVVRCADCVPEGSNLPTVLA